MGSSFVTSGCSDDLEYREEYGLDGVHNET